EDAISWIEETIDAMTLEEKIGQLFVNMGSSRDKNYLSSMVNQYHIGAVRYNPGTADEVYDQNYILQTESKIPLLIAANTEAGGNGACTDGTEVGVEVKIGATNDAKYAYELGRVSGIEASAIGCNWSFAPIVDINRNWRNPIISSRSFGQSPDKVLELSLAYMKGIQESGILPAAKHFPGDGIDERDQHLSFSINSLSTEEWDNSFGKVYSGLIEAGLPSIMAGHIHMPAYSKHFNLDLKDEDLLPATLSKELITDLLRGKLGFNGLVVTDASHMLGMTGAMKRSELLPTSIAAGCDLFLFFNDPDEDFNYMMEGYYKGIISEERLRDALRRILGLKAKLGLHKKEKNKILLPKQEAMEKIGLIENKSIFKEVADQAITLVKDKQDIWPIVPEKYKRILLVDVHGVKGGFGEVVAGNRP
ncbi:TPA: beta-hexosaminidase, partial [Enterococcus faecium]|nr:beta-hexosaminidase [Enterococcus faecium]